MEETPTLEPPRRRLGNRHSVDPGSVPPPESRRVNHGLKKNSLGVPSIFFYIIAAASPLTVVVALYPIIIGAGNPAPWNGWARTAPSISSTPAT